MHEKRSAARGRAGTRRRPPRGRRAAVLFCLAVLLWVPAPAARAFVPCEAVGVSPYDHPVLTADGSRVVFTTNAALVPADENRTLDVYAQDVASGAPELVSVTPDARAANARSGAPAVTADGRLVAFESDATDIVAGDDAAGATDVFVRDTIAGTTELISVSGEGVRGSGASRRPAIDPSGTRIAFESTAPDLVPADTNNLTDVFVRDRAAGTTTRVSVATDGTQADGLGSFAPSISANGRVAFHSTASTWVQSGSDPRSFLRDGVYYVRNVYVHDLADATTTHVSVTFDGNPADGLSLHPAISQDGQRIAFLSSSTNLVPDDTNNRPDLKGFSQSDVFVRDLAAGTTIRVSIASHGAQANGLGSSGAAVSGDGAMVAFESDATNLTAGDENGTLDVFVRDAGTTRRASATQAGADPGSAGRLAFGSVSASLSADGGTVAFASSTPGLIGPTAEQTPHVFGALVRSLTTGALTGPFGIGCPTPVQTAGVRARHAREHQARSVVRAAPVVGVPSAADGAAPSRGTPVWPVALIVVSWIGVVRHARRPAAAGIALVLGAMFVAPASASAHHHAPLQPGGPSIRDAGFGVASLNFVFRDRTTGQLFMGTAAHAVRDLWPGARIANDEVGEYGTLVYAREGVFSFSTQDFALIKIDPDKESSVEPAVRHWGGPAAVARINDLLPGLPTYQYGQASFFRTSEATRLKPGVVGPVTTDDWGYIGWVSEVRGGFGGDSGSPILVGPDGEALAVTILFASAAYSEPGVQMGPTIEMILQELRLAGFDVDLVTAPFHGPTGDVGSLVEHCAARPIEETVSNDGCIRPGSDL